jgi:hypothetical protein
MGKRIFGFQVIIGIMIIVGVLFSLSKYNNKQTVKTKVIDKERVITSANSYYLIFTEDGTFKLEDDLIYGNFNSSDWYGQIRRDSTYTFSLIGYRIGLMSEYPNIISFKK